MAKDNKHNHTQHTPPSPKETTTVSPEVKKAKETTQATQQQVLDTLNTNPVLEGLQKGLGDICTLTPEDRNGHEWIHILPKGAKTRGANYPIDIIATGNMLYNVKLTDYNEYEKPPIIGEKMTKEEVLGSINIYKTFLKEGLKMKFPAGSKFDRDTSYDDLLEGKKDVSSHLNTASTKPTTTEKENIKPSLASTSSASKEGDKNAEEKKDVKTEPKEKKNETKEKVKDENNEEVEEKDSKPENKKEEKKETSKKKWYKPWSWFSEKEKKDIEKKDNKKSDTKKEGPGLWKRVKALPRQALHLTGGSLKFALWDSWGMLAGKDARKKIFGEYVNGFKVK